MRKLETKSTGSGRVTMVVGGTSLNISGTTKEVAWIGAMIEATQAKQIKRSAVIPQDEYLQTR